jgi:hypothetical protein
MSHAPIQPLERAVRVELTNTGFAIQRLIHLATRANWNGRRDSNSRDEFGRLACFQLHHFRKNEWLGRGGQSRTVATSSQDSDANATPHPETLVRQVRLELTIPCLRGRCFDPIWLLTHGGTERTRTVIGLVDNQVPHLSATVPIKFWVGRRELNPHDPRSQCGALPLSYDPHERATRNRA